MLHQGARRGEYGVEVYNERLDRWETENLSDLVATVPLSYQTRLAFTHARHTRVVDKHLGCLKIRLPAHPQQILWVLVLYDPQQEKELFLLTNIPLDTAAAAKQVLREWRMRAQVEHTYRFDQEDGLNLEDVRVHTLERMRRIFVLVLLAALFVYHIDQSWSPDAVLWLRRLGGKFGPPSDADGPYVLLAGIQAVFVTAQPDEARAYLGDALDKVRSVLRSLQAGFAYYTTDNQHAADVARDRYIADTYFLYCFCKVRWGQSRWGKTAIHRHYLFSHTLIWQWRSNAI